MKLTIYLTLCYCVWVTLAIQIPLQKAPNQFHKIHDSSKQLLFSRTTTGSSVPLQGGILSFGAYFLNITIGKQKFSVLLDTGSSNLIVSKLPSTSTNISCSSATCTKCTPDHPQTSWASNDTCVFGSPYCIDGVCGLGVSYGGGSSVSTGLLYSDNFCIGELCVNTVFGVSPDPPQADDLPQGIIGFASEFNSCNPTCIATPLDNLVAANLSSNLFGLCITENDGGVLDIGEIDSSKYSGTLQYVPLEVERWYNLILNDIWVGNQSIGVPPVYYRTTNDVIGSFVDSGTTLLLFGPLIFQNFVTTFQSSYCQLPGICGTNNFFTGASFPSSVIDPVINQFPDLVFVIQGQNGEIQLPLSATSYLLNFDGYYSMGIQSIFGGIGVVFGDVFMQSYYIVFDRQNLQLGFAPVSNCVPNS